MLSGAKRNPSVCESTSPVIGDPAQLTSAAAKPFLAVPNLATWTTNTPLNFEMTLACWGEGIRPSIHSSNLAVIPSWSVAFATQNATICRVAFQVPCQPGDTDITLNVTDPFGA